MSTPYLGEIRMVSFPFAAKGFAFCNGQTMQITQNQALFALIGITYGGNGTSNFMLPNLQGRSALHFGNGYTLGQQGGEPTHALAIAEMPQHNHLAYVSNNSTQHAAANNLPGSGSNTNIYDSKAGTNAAMNSGVIGLFGGGVAHENRMPYLAVNFVIALAGIYPTRS